MLAAYSDKSAYAQCVFAFCPNPGSKIRVFAGRTTGTIVSDMFGSQDLKSPKFFITFSVSQRTPNNKFYLIREELALLSFVYVELFVV